MSCRWRSRIYTLLTRLLYILQWIKWNNDYSSYRDKQKQNPSRVHVLLTKPQKLFVTPPCRLAQAASVFVFGVMEEPHTDVNKLNCCFLPRHCKMPTFRPETLRWATSALSGAYYCCVNLWPRGWIPVKSTEDSALFVIWGKCNSGIIIRLSDVV